MSTDQKAMCGNCKFHDLSRLPAFRNVCDNVESDYFTKKTDDTHICEYHKPKEVPDEK